MVEQTHLALPFVVGITGHRRVADPDLLKTDLERNFTEIAACVPACRPVLLSALAAGADQIAARVALELGWQLVAVLPFSPDDERHGFSDKEKAEFDNLLLEASHWIDAPAVAGLGLPGQNDHVADEEHFLAVGRYMANTSHVLVSAWDGLDTAAVGGTADVTHYRLNLLPLRIDPLSLDPVLEEWKLVLVVPTRRLGDEREPSCPAGWYKNRAAVDDRRPDFSDAHSALQPFQPVNKASAEIQAAEGTIAAGDELDCVYTAADHLAVIHVSWLQKNWKYSFGLALLALVSAGIYGDLKEFTPMPPMLLFVYLSSLAVLWAWLRHEQRESENRLPWDWRLLAEIVRVLRVWRNAGHDEFEPSLAPTLGARHHVPAWVIHVYRGLSLVGAHSCRTQGGNGREDFDAVKRNWVDCQIAYFDKVIRAARRRKILRHLSAICLPVGVAFAVLCLVLEVLGQVGNLLSFCWFVASLLPSLGAAGLVFSHLREKAGASAAALRQRENFMALRGIMEGNTDLAKARAQIAETGRLAIAEVCIFHHNAKLTHGESSALLG